LKLDYEKLSIVVRGLDMMSALRTDILTDRGQYLRWRLRQRMLLHQRVIAKHARGRANVSNEPPPGA
jgi:hypothetical protein